jgi:ArsR family transcriptional regulator
MGVTKTENFTAEQNRMATVAKAIAHPARIAILEYLLKASSCITNDLVDELPLAQATISQHLKELKNIGIIKGTIEGTSVCYCIDEEVWNALRTSFAGFFGQAFDKKGCC